LPKTSTESLGAVNEGDIGEVCDYPFRDEPFAWAEFEATVAAPRPREDFGAIRGAHSVRSDGVPGIGGRCLKDASLGISVDIGHGTQR